MTEPLPRVVGPEDGDLGWLASIGVRLMISSEESGGGFSLVEHPMPPKALAAPLHRHSREDEYSYGSRAGSARSWASTSSRAGPAT
jgi:hypothetical protein